MLSLRDCGELTDQCNGFLDPWAPRDGGVETQAVATKLMIHYFVGADADFLADMGADRRKLPSAAEWFDVLEQEFAQPIEKKQFFYLVWMLDDVPIGHCNNNLLLSKCSGRSVMATLAYFEGQIVPFEKATVSIMCNTLHYGTGCFGGLRAYWNEDYKKLYAFRLLDHYRRFLNSAKLLMCSFDYTPEQLRDITITLLSREGWRQDVYIRPLAYKDDDIVKLSLHEGTDKVAIFSQPYDKYISADAGAKVCVSSWRRVDDTAIPARGKTNGAYVNSALIKSEAMLNGFDDAIVLNQDGHVSEGSAANFMMVRNGVVITPPVTANILEGITRHSLITLLREELELKVVEREIDRSEIYLADEAFFCGTGVQIAAIGSIDHRTIGHGGTGPVTQQTRELFFRVLRGEESKYMNWLSPVPVAEENK